MNKQRKVVITITYNEMEIIVDTKAKEVAQPEQSIAEWQKDFREYINMLNIPRDDYNGIIEYINDVPFAQPNLQPTCNQFATDAISRQAAIDALGTPHGILYPIRTIEELPSAEPEYKPVKAEDFAKIMSENTLYGFMAWHGEALGLMERQGFVICKKTM